ncbi:MAG: DUF2459 domain-containing protein [Bacteroidota bacterium]
MRSNTFAKRLLKGILILISIPLLYFLMAYICSNIEVGENSKSEDAYVYLNTNGIHLDIILPKAYLSPALQEGLKETPSTAYYSFGWGDRDFYLNTPEWKDLKFSTAFSAMFLKSPTLMHVSRYRNSYSDWAKIPISLEQLAKLNSYILETFAQNESGEKILLEGRGYSWNDDFYEAKGNYSCFNTCNSWVNGVLKKSGLQACLWTPFDFSLMEIHTAAD